MATASGDANRARRGVMPLVAYAIVLASIGWGGFAFGCAGRGNFPKLPGIDSLSPPSKTLASVDPSPVVSPRTEPSSSAQGLKLPPLPAAPETPAPAPQDTAQGRPQAPAASTPSPPTEAVNSGAAPAPSEKPEPPRTVCAGGASSWPTERTEQGKAIQGLLRDLGLYEGTVYGTVGPATRAAIRKFQLSSGQAETGEPDEALFDSLKKTCVSRSRP